jgi:hypothetical protein
MCMIKIRFLEIIEAVVATRPVKRLRVVAGAIAKQMLPTIKIHAYIICSRKFNTKQRPT